ncbi:1-acyl-sn-glycerol-3-phosphate acyltransferase [bacterium]|nr:1-acyl-sn-glycerol-3-phosphate acyltransferase [bacterium]
MLIEMKTLKLIYFNIVFYTLFLSFSAISIPVLSLFVAFLSLFLSHRNTMKRIRITIGWWALGIIKIILLPVARIQYKNRSEINILGPYIFVCNHRSFSDGFLLALPCMPHECIQIVNTWPFKIPVIGLIAKLAGYLSINEMPFDEFSRRACELLRQGVSIAAFPEGTRSADKKIGQFHSSIFRVALQVQCPIIPICISGNENIPPRRSLLLHQGIIKMHKLPCLEWEQYKDLGAFKLKNKVRDIIAKELAAMEDVA